MAVQYLFDNEGSEDKGADTEEEEKALADRDTWSGIANSSGFHIIIKGKIFYVVTSIKWMSTNYVHF